MIIKYISGFLFLLASHTGQAQYIYEVLEYTPAPGQFINTLPWGHPQSAQSIIGTTTGSLSLGAFGGYVIFRFEEPVQNHPDNPFGVDFIIFGNPFTGFAEPGIVSVMKDENGNGIPDGTWYELAGSDYFFSSTLHQNEVTYVNPGGDEAADVPWTDNYGNSGVVLAKSFHEQPYYPDSALFPHIHPDQYTLDGTRIMGHVDMSTPGVVISGRRAFGYADNHLRGTGTVTSPPNPYTPQAENAGGDGFDIGWAVDQDGNYVDLDEIHFIKVHTAMLADAGWLGEISTEITGAVVTEPNPDITGILDMVVMKDLPVMITTTQLQMEALSFHRGRVQWERQISWSTDLEGSHIDPDGVLHLTQSGEITVTAWWTDNPDIAATMTTLVDLEDDPTGISEFLKNDMGIYPNPATGNFQIQGAPGGQADVFDMFGRRVMVIPVIEQGEIIKTHQLAPGTYFVRISHGLQRKTLRLIIH